MPDPWRQHPLRSRAPRPAAARHKGWIGGNHFRMSLVKTLKPSARLLEAAKFIRVLQSRQGPVIAALEEIAYLNGWIGWDELNALAKKPGQVLWTPLDRECLPLNSVFWPFGAQHVAMSKVETNAIDDVYSALSHIIEGARTCSGRTTLSFNACRSSNAPPSSVCAIRTLCRLQ